MVNYVTNNSNILIFFNYHPVYKLMNQFLQVFLDPKLAPTAVRVSLIVGSILFTINHGAALAKGEMTRNRWLSGLITYLVPYSVSIHGQYTSRSRSSIEN